MTVYSEQDSSLLGNEKEEAKDDASFHEMSVMKNPENEDLNSTVKSYQITHRPITVNLTLPKSNDSERGKLLRESESNQSNAGESWNWSLVLIFSPYFSGSIR